MSITYEWIITRLELHDDGVAYQACFDVKGSDGPLQGFAQSDTLLTASSGPFTPIESVTKEQAAEWVKTALGPRVKEFEDRVAEQIERQRKPKSRQFTPAWNTQEHASEDTSGS